MDIKSFQLILFGVCPGLFLILGVWLFYAIRTKSVLEKQNKELETAISAINVEKSILEERYSILSSEKCQLTHWEIMPSTCSTGQA